AAAGGERVRASLRVGNRGVVLGSPLLQTASQGREPGLCCARYRDDALAFVCDGVQCVELRQCVVERLRSEHDGERADVTLFVERAQVLSKFLLRDGERARRRRDLPGEQRLPATQTL